MTLFKFVEITVFEDPNKLLSSDLFLHYENPCPKCSDYVKQISCQRKRKTIIFMVGIIIANSPSLTKRTALGIKTLFFKLNNLAFQVVFSLGCNN